MKKLLRTTFLSLCPLMFLYTLPASAAVGVGDSTEKVIAELGRPDATICSPEQEVYYYERGKVILVNGKVDSVQLISQDEYQEEQARRNAARAEREATRLEMARSIKEAKLADPAFQNAPPEQQVAYWEQFKRNHPEISVEGAYTRALQRLLEHQIVELRRAAEERRIAELEARVREAEARAAAAQTVAVAAPRVPEINVTINQEAPAAVPARGHGHDHHPGHFSRGGFIGTGRFIRSARPTTSGSRFGQGSSVFRPPLPPAPLATGAFNQPF